MSSPVGNNPIDLYQKDFNRIVKVAWQAYLDLKQQSRRSLEWIYNRDIQYKKSLLNIYYTLTKIQIPINIRLDLELEDLKQELSLKWIEWYRKFQNQKHHKTSLRDYLYQCSKFGLETYFISQFFVQVDSFQQSSQLSTQPLCLDLKFLVQGSSLFSELLPFERYLLFLKYKQEKSIIDIAYTVQKDKGTVRKQLTQTMSTLRRLSNGGTYTR